MLLAPILVGVSLSQVPEPPPLPVVAWQVPPGCPDADALQHAIAQRLGRPLAPGEATVSGRIARRREAPRYHLRLRLSARGRSDERELSARECGPLVDATALLVVLAMGETPSDGAASMEGTSSETDATSSPAGFPPQPAVLETMDAAAVATPPVVEHVDARPLFAPTHLEPPADAHPPAVPPRPAAPGWFLRVHGGPEYGAVPGLSGAVGLATGALWPRARLEFHGIHLAARTAGRDDNLVRVLVAAGAVLGCARPGGPRVEFPLCGGLEFGAMRGSARGPGARTVTGPWLAGIVSAGAAWHVHPRGSLTLALQGIVRLVGPRFELRDPGPTVTLFEPAVLSGRLLVGVELRLGDRR